jgi:hypothetical protein
MVFIQSTTCSTDYQCINCHTALILHRAPVLTNVRTERLRALTQLDTILLRKKRLFCFIKSFAHFGSS